MKLKIGLVAASLFGAILASPAASAMPIAPAPAVPQVSAVEAGVPDGPVEPGAGKVTAMPPSPGPTARRYSGAPATSAR